MEILHFLSDLHLSEQTPKLTELFKNYLNNLDSNVKNIYILGDLFDVWIGDDFLDYQNNTNDNNYYAEICKFIKNIKLSKNINFYFLRGNRDFLISSKFTDFSGIQILADRYFFDNFNNYNLQLIISHGDEFCTDDLAYMQFRNLCRTKQWQQQILAMSIQQRLALAQQIKSQSEADKNGIYKDINEQSFTEFINNLNNKNNTNNNIIYIHGHTHISGEHNYKISQKNVKRWVLADWRENQKFAEITTLTFDKQSYLLHRKQL